MNHLEIYYDEASFRTSQCPDFLSNFPLFPFNFSFQKHHKFLKKTNADGKSRNIADFRMESIIFAVKSIFLKENARKESFVQGFIRQIPLNFSLILMIAKGNFHMFFEEHAKLKKYGGFSSESLKSFKNIDIDISQ